jgi:hypothetical protein
MLKRFKIMASAFVLAGLTLPLAAQQMTVTREAVPQAAPKKVDLRPKYWIVRDKVLTRTDKTGTTRFGYQNGRLATEIRPNGVVGTYQYDSDRFSGVVYTDGRYIKASYGPNGVLLGLTSDTSARVKFNSNGTKPTHLQSFKAVQNGIAALRSPTASNSCVGTDDDATCTIIVLDSLPDDGGMGGDMRALRDAFEKSADAIADRDYAKALELLIWIHDNPDPTAKSSEMFRRAHGFFALGVLAKVYEPAMEALKGLVAEKRVQVAAGTADAAMQVDLRSLEEALQYAEE